MLGGLGDGTNCSAQTRTVRAEEGDITCLLGGGLAGGVVAVASCYLRALL